MPVRYSRFQISETTNYSTKSRSYCRGPSKTPCEDHHCGGASTTPEPHYGFSMAAYFQLIKNFLKHGHKETSTVSDCSAIYKLEEDKKVARRNAMDLGTRSEHKEPLMGLLVAKPIPLRVVERENVPLQVVDEEGYLGNDENAERKFVLTSEFSTTEDSAPENPSRENVRTLGHVLAWMHNEGINFAGFSTTEREKRECMEGRCRCLGPLMREV